MQAFEINKNVMQQRQEKMHMLKQGRARRRDEKYAGRGGPPDCEEVQAETFVEAEVDENVSALAGECAREERAGDWDIVGADEHVHSPRSCRPPCTSRTHALCTVS